MSARYVMRPARIADLEAVYVLAQMTGGGFLNLPPDREALKKRLAWSEESFAHAVDVPGNELYMLLLEDTAMAAVMGSALIFSQIGVEWPFYTYKLSTLAKHSKVLGRAVSARVLNLTTDFDGASEVGGLFLHPELRTGGHGRLLSRARYLFIAAHRARFADRIVAELRGWHRPDGGSPFWDGLAGKFFGMGFQEADKYNSLHGNQFIADLMPKLPVYVDLLSDEARSVLGRPHDSGVPALKLLEAEGFSYDGYVDIFDGGPTVSARTSQLRTVAASRLATACPDLLAPPVRAMVATGERADFRCWIADAKVDGDHIELDGVERDTPVRWVAA